MRFFRPSVTTIARTCHEVNRAYCASIDDNTQLPWDQAPQWQRDSAVAGVKFMLVNPTAGPEDAHINWSKDKLADGWVYGPVKDAVLKRHPCLVAYKKLPKKQRAKDSLFEAIVRSMEK